MDIPSEKPKKDGRGRPRLSEEEKIQRAKDRQLKLKAERAEKGLKKGRPPLLRDKDGQIIGHGKRKGPYTTITKLSKKQVKELTVLKKETETGTLMKRDPETNLKESEEIFCHAFLESGNYTAAYNIAMPASKAAPVNKSRNAYTWSCKPEIIARIKQLRVLYLERKFTNIDSLVQELDETRTIALTPDRGGKTQAAAAVSATMGKAKIIGADGEAKSSSGNTFNVVIQNFAKNN